ncbi:hypothetical protein [Dinoroseobacter sp. S124A]|uniref:hypothetical protein n=1 Tax=Dinoroseobacter sp. S124A TaxID=3415128 RepID=UPI003C7EB9A3
MTDFFNKMTSILAGAVVLLVGGALAGLGLGVLALLAMGGMIALGLGLLAAPFVTKLAEEEIAKADAAQTI